MSAISAVMPPCATKAMTNATSLRRIACNTWFGDVSLTAAMQRTANHGWR